MYRFELDLFLFKAKVRFILELVREIPVYEWRKSFQRLMRADEIGEYIRIYEYQINGKNAIKMSATSFNFQSILVFDTPIIKNCCSFNNFGDSTLAKPSSLQNTLHFNMCDVRKTIIIIYHNIH